MELYGSGDTNDASPEQVASCATELRSLEHSLLDHAAQDVRWPVRAKVTQQWIAQWDKRYAAVEHCGSLETARKRLRQMRERTVALIQAHTRKTVPLAESIDRMLDQISARTPS
jgi:hydrogenase maturation factor HypF (carbamoyltransferase family)